MLGGGWEGKDKVNITCSICPEYSFHMHPVRTVFGVGLDYTMYSLLIHFPLHMYLQIIANT